MRLARLGQVVVVTPQVTEELEAMAVIMAQQGLEEVEHAMDTIAVQVATAAVVYV